MTKRPEYCEDFNVGDCVTIVDIGWGWVTEITEFGYHLYIANKRISGGGYKDYDLRPKDTPTKYTYPQQARCAARMEIERRGLEVDLIKHDWMRHSTDGSVRVVINGTWNGYTLTVEEREPIETE